ncbi:hypothetical protein JAAARDRAFT_157371 [Jaapia argillacea MUCL 33604]|uniref:FAD-binding domain-containing protein n=1 Tax=Jaapia argillacea MUCL 33604 TaxID=933084 RepID=A0A067PR28_9AGAM|nr:hypothetical protein JAAARDRAFT_157371 [Jaapia argillacea MUCL 33604]
MRPSKFRVAICGGGVGGLTFAVALSGYPDIAVDIYEAANTFTEMGAGIGMWPRTRKIMRSLGLEDGVKKLGKCTEFGQSAPVFHYRKSDQPEGFDFFDLSTPGGLTMLHRAAFHQFLLDRLTHTQVTTHTSKRLTSYTQPSPSPSPITLSFQDGTTATCDVLIGADGYRSAIRAGMVQEMFDAGVDLGCLEGEGVEKLKEPMWSGTVAWRAMVPFQKLEKVLPRHRAMCEPTQYLGKNGFIIMYPVTQQGEKLLNFVAFRMKHDLEGTPYHGPWVAKNQSREDFERDFEGWETEVQDLIKCVEKPLLWSIHVARPLPSFAHKRVAIMGDAAHAMLPHQGSGAGQAIDDAYTLAKLLGHPLTTVSTLPTALAAYDSVRRPFAMDIMSRSREAGRLFTFYHPELDCSVGGDEMDHRKKLEEMSERLVRNWKWAWESEIDGDVKKALGMFEAKVGKGSVRNGVNGTNGYSC